VLQWDRRARFSGVQTGSDRSMKSATCLNLKLDPRFGSRRAPNFGLDLGPVQVQTVVLDRTMASLVPTGVQMLIVYQDLVWVMGLRAKQIQVMATSTEPAT
jgi:hypothetical protein